MNEIKIVIKVTDGYVVTTVNGNTMPYASSKNIPFSLKGVVEVTQGITLNFDKLKLLKPILTVEQQTVLMGLLTLGYKYIARDEGNALFAYDRPPYRDKGSKGFWNSQYFSIDLNLNSTIHVLDNLCSWEDEKPTSIEWLLGKKDKNE